MSPPLSINAWLRFDAIRAAVRKAQPTSILEIGAGQGAMGSWLSEQASYVGFEPDVTSRATAAARVEGRGAMVDALPDGTFDLACAFEVLEHIDDDAEALRLWHEHLNEGGWLVLSVPGHRKRFGAWDARVGHFRRYDRDDLDALLTENGYEVESISLYGGGLGHLLEGARNVVARMSSGEGSMEERTARSGRSLQASSLVAPLLYLVAAPFRLLQRPFSGSSFGTGFVVTARRR